MAEEIVNVTVTVALPVPTDIRSFELVRESGESDDSYARRRDVVDKLLELGLMEGDS